MNSKHKESPAQRNEKVKGGRAEEVSRELNADYKKKEGRKTYLIGKGL